MRRHNFKPTLITARLTNTAELCLHTIWKYSVPGLRMPGWLTRHPISTVPAGNGPYACINRISRWICGPPIWLVSSYWIFRIIRDREVHTSGYSMHFLTARIYASPNNGADGARLWCRYL